MIATIRHKTDATRPPRSCVVCEACRAFGPEVPGDEKPAEAAAVAAGWVIHEECVRTPVRKHRTSARCIQYFCPACRGKVGTVPAYTRSHKRKVNP